MYGTPSYLYPYQLKNLIHKKLFFIACFHMRISLALSMWKHHWSAHSFCFRLTVFFVLIGWPFIVLIRCLWGRHWQMSHTNVSWVPWECVMDWAESPIVHVSSLTHWLQVVHESNFTASGSRKNEAVHLPLQLHSNLNNVQSHLIST